VQDLFAPEINSQVPGGPAGGDWTTDNASTRQYDSYKVTAVLNEIDGFDHSHTNHVGTPAIFGMNFQTVSTAEKLPTSDGMTGGYLADGVTPGPLLSTSLDYINTQIGAFVSELRRDHLDRKHRDHPVRQARPEPDPARRPDQDPRRPTDRRPERRMGRGTPRRRPTGRPGHR